ncbi:hypothetical protein [Actinokineospora sp. HUAS TT18]|uniref:hypothetical protein n=1 Tax=Actinokineospora sp. HUAS TT18 TaxID=3447451 RepID=UPI003F527E44
MVQRDRNGDGLIDIDTDEALRHLAVLRAAGTDFATVWQAANGRISSPGKIGQGPMGTAFMENYREAAATLSKSAGETPGHFGTLTDNGTKAVQSYVDGEAAATSRFT